MHSAELEATKRVRLAARDGGEEKIMNKPRKRKERRNRRCTSEGEAVLVRRRAMESERREQAVPESVLHPVAMATVNSKGGAVEPCRRVLTSGRMKQLRGLNKVCKFRQLRSGCRTRATQTHFIYFSCVVIYFFRTFSDQCDSHEEGTVRRLVSRWIRTDPSSLPKPPQRRHSPD